MPIAWEDSSNRGSNDAKKTTRAGEGGGGEETQHFSINFQINQKIKTAVSGLQPFVQRYFFEFAGDRDKELVADFILSCITTTFIHHELLA
jgi:hypothetical protein